METKVTRITPQAAPAKLEYVAAYARVSSGKDAMLHSLSAQVSHYSNLIQRTPGWVYAGVFADEGTPYGQIPKGCSTPYFFPLLMNVLHRS